MSIPIQYGKLTANDRQDVSDHIEPRESMRVLPHWFQIFLTWQTGKPLSDERPSNLRPIHHLLKAVLACMIGIALSFIAISHNDLALFLLLPGWVLTLHGLRCFRLPIYHQCAHENFTGNKRIDILVGKAISMILITQELFDYSNEHKQDHHGPSNMTTDDPTVKSLILLYGLRAGMTRQECYVRLGRTLLSPSFHIRSIFERVLAHFLPASFAQRSISVLFYVAVIGLVSITNMWMVFLVGWVFPLTILYNISNTLRLCVKHIFPATHTVRKGVGYFSSLTYAIFLGDPAPDSGLMGWSKISAWTIWTVRLLLVHIPIRLCILTGDTVCHDYHHAHGEAKDWPNYIYARDKAARLSEEKRNNIKCAQHAVSGHNPSCEACVLKNNNVWNYRETWTFASAMNLVFDSLTHADPSYYAPHNMKISSSYEIFAALDE